MHGGKAGPPKDNQNARTHGIYSKALNEEEQGLWHIVQVGSLDDEIRLAKLRLKRAVEADRDEQVQILLRRVERLEATRAAMLDRGHTPDDPQETARTIAKALDEIEADARGEPVAADA